jgi:hypothetical protein
VANGLRSPRGILFDSKGNLPVVQQGLGIVQLEFDDGGSTCLCVQEDLFDQFNSSKFHVSRIGSMLIALS